MADDIFAPTNVSPAIPVAAPKPPVSKRESPKQAPVSNAAAAFHAGQESVLKKNKATKKEKTYTKEDMTKAVNESFVLGYKSGLKKANVSSVFPTLESEIQITSLAKTLDHNGRKINKEIIENHTKVVKQSMQAWKADQQRALDDVLALLHDHKNDK